MAGEGQLCSHGATRCGLLTSSWALICLDFGLSLSRTATAAGLFGGWVMLGGCATRFDGLLGISIQCSLTCFICRLLLS